MEEETGIKNVSSSLNYGVKPLKNVCSLTGGQTGKTVRVALTGFTSSNP